ncbi:glycosyltransferase [Bacillus benzoevorans]|uniref:Glycosyltransferase involved in cell wall biosynthesis n=1 Tax=Bacillus benzoevorans TaxID=1456 RepID=A0A7X0HWE5_9BACI|nr:glycosyltransferase [Bacillus benzoevorans]MBB6446841.1 glycosyltransferase involved in cell wall biosynthesis [Bacillus benzoevorans]
MRILFLSAASNIHTVRWVNALAGRGHDVHLAYNADHVPAMDQINKEVQLHQLKYSGLLGYYLNAVQLARLCKKINPDVINCHYASGYGTLSRMAKLKPLILSVWGSDVYDFPYEGKWKMRILQKNICYANKIASTSYSMAKQVEKVMERNMNITITPFGVDTNLFKPVDIQKEPFVFGTVKTLSEKYGIEYIIRGFKILLDRIEEEGFRDCPVLEIYGKGDLEEELINLCKELNLADKVFFKGYIPNNEVPQAINRMDVFCVGSVNESESFGVAAVEAMACEVPVIATDVSGFKEVMIHGETGYLVPKKNAAAIGEKMYELMLDEKLRKRFGRNGRKRVLECYAWKQNVTLMEELYHTMWTDRKMSNKYAN